MDGEISYNPEIASLSTKSCDKKTGVSSEKSPYSHGSMDENPFDHSTGHHLEVLETGQGTIRDPKEQEKTAELHFLVDMLKNSAKLSTSERISATSCCCTE